jgi:hypothetical protein
MLSGAHDYDNGVDSLAVLKGLCEEHVQCLGINSRLLVDRNSDEVS